MERWLFAMGGAGDVRAHLLDMTRWLTKARNNSWMTAFYEARADSIWYRPAGFREIANRGASPLGDVLTCRLGLLHESPLGSSRFGLGTSHADGDCVGPQLTASRP